MHVFYYYYYYYYFTECAKQQHRGAVIFHASRAFIETIPFPFPHVLLNGKNEYLCDVVAPFETGRSIHTEFGYIYIKKFIFIFG